VRKTCLAVKEVAATITKDPLDSLVVKFEKAFEFADEYTRCSLKTLLGPVV